MGYVADSDSFAEMDLTCNQNRQLSSSLPTSPGPRQEGFSGGAGSTSPESRAIISRG